MSFHTSDNDREGISFDDLKYDEAAFEVFFKKHYTSLCAYCQFKFGFDLDLASEMVHTAYVKLWEQRKQLSGTQSPLGYLHKTISNNALDLLRHEKVRQQYAIFIQHNAVPEELVNSIDFKQLRDDVDGAISELPEQMQRIFVLSRFEGMKYAEIAGLLGISVKTVETQMSRALSKLREKLGGYLTLLLLIMSAFFKK